MIYELVISDIKNYKVLIRTAQNLTNELVGIDHQLHGIHGSSFDDIDYKGKSVRQYYHGRYISEMQKIEINESLLKQQHKLQEELAEINKRIASVKYAMEHLPTETLSMIKTIYWGKGWEYAKKLFKRSSSSLQWQMRKDIEKL